MIAFGTTFSLTLEINIIDGSVVFEVILGQVGFFKRGVTYALFHWSEKIFSERERLMILHIGYWYMVCWGHTNSLIWPGKWDKGWERRNYLRKMRSVFWPYLQRLEWKTEAWLGMKCSPLWPFEFVSIFFIRTFGCDLCRVRPILNQSLRGQSLLSWIISVYQLVLALLRRLL